ncbi:TetR/AcrR family transcriptional regulator [Portibacter lacus]|uniref:TetR family transcriptional regulator n=1 Tax=Portibacter lacus TaxID=1099794 RepID=A0AA37STT3_9BACT|nr:TetR/AcrR family transcriptional regulator [Portibacter lacus]GLR19479.1 TetR family transcriptional regulator [Portibacter lacus]
MSESSDIKITKSVAALISVGKELFWKYGIKRITVEEICDKAEVSKMTFYRNFSNKHELALLIFKGVVAENVNSYNAIMSSEQTFPDKVKDLLDLKRRESKNMSVEFMEDVYSGDNEFAYLKNYISEYSSKFLVQLKGDFKTAQDEGFIRSDMNVDFIIFMLQKFQNVAEDPSLRKIYSSTEDLAMEVANLFFYGIMNENKE